jgi:hypothetical protein
MKKLMMSASIAAVLTACGGGGSELAAVGSGTDSESGGGAAPAPAEAPTAIAQFEQEVLTRLQQSNWIAAVGNDARDCKAEEAADFCRRQWVQFADGARVSLDSAGLYYHPISENVLSNTAVSQETPQAAAHTSECLRTAMEHAQAAGLQLTYFDRLFTDTTVFLGYSDNQFASIELADGSCFATWDAR